MAYSIAYTKTIVVGSHGGVPEYANFFSGGEVYEPITTHSQLSSEELADRTRCIDENGNKKSGCIVHGVDASIIYLTEQRDRSVIYAMISRDTANVMTAYYYITNNYISGDNVFLLGYSAGGKFVINLAQLLSNGGYPVHIMGLIDPIVGVTSMYIPSNVQKIALYHQESDVMDMQGFNSFTLSNESEYFFGHPKLIEGYEMHHFSIPFHEDVWKDFGNKMVAFVDDVAIDDNMPPDSGNSGSDPIYIPPPEEDGQDPKGHPDLVFSDLKLRNSTGQVTTTVEYGEAVNFSYRVDNIGHFEPEHDLYIHVWRSDGKKLDDNPDDMGNDKFDNDDLDPGEHVRGDENFIAPTSLHDNGYNFIVCAHYNQYRDNPDEALGCSEVFRFDLAEPNQQPVGYLDIANCSTIKGWAKDPNTIHPIDIHFYADGNSNTGTFMGSIKANEYRGDLPYTDKHHGFTAAVPESLKNGKPHTIYAYAIDDQGGYNPVLGNSPKFINGCVGKLKWYLDFNDNGIWDMDIDTIIEPFGISTDMPITGDWNGDGVDNIGTARMKDGHLSWYLDFNGNGIWETGIDIVIESFGISTDMPITGDWDGDGVDNIGTARIDLR